MSDVLDFRIDDLPDPEVFRERSAEIQQTIERKAGETRDLVGAVGWDTVRDTACRKLGEGLKGADWFTWLAKGWTLSQELKAAARDTLGDDTAEKVISLHSHSLSQLMHPVVTLVCEPLELELTFDLALSGAIDSADLVVRGGRLAAVQAGRLVPEAELTYRGVRLGKKKGKPIDLVVPFVFPGGGLKLVDEPPEAVAAE